MEAKEKVSLLKNVGNMKRFREDKEMKTSKIRDDR